MGGAAEEEEPQGHGPESRCRKPERLRCTTLRLHRVPASFDSPRFLRQSRSDSPAVTRMKSIQVRIFSVTERLESRIAPAYFAFINGAFVTLSSEATSDTLELSA